eukprot:gene2281-4439_t
MNHSSASDGNITRQLQSLEICDKTASSNPSYQKYFTAMKNIYENDQGTCVPVHRNCGWARSPENKLPLFVLSVGLEGAGHHLWTELLERPVFDCVWKNARHYQRDVADGVPRTTTAKLSEGLREQLALRKENGLAPCRSIYDSEDSFPTGAIRKSGRLFMRPDLINLQKLDGILFDIKYIIILRNVTVKLRTVEHTLTYVEAAMRGVPCHKTFIAHYEHVLTDPSAYIGPLSDFLQLTPSQIKVLSSRLSTPSHKQKPAVPSRKKHKLTQYKECKERGLDSEGCYQQVLKLLETFFYDRAFLWPTFAGNGFEFNRKT